MPDESQQQGEGTTPPQPATGPLPGERGDPAPPLPRKHPVWWWVRHILQIVIPLIIIWLVWEELSELSFSQLRAQFATASLTHVALAVATALAAVLLTGFYDVLAFPHTPKQGATRRWGLGALFFSWTNFVALGPVGVPFLRLHWYGKAGMETGDVIRGVGRLYVGMGTGLAAWALASVLPLHGHLGPLERTAVALVLAPVLSVLIYWLRSRVRNSLRTPTPMRTMAMLGVVGGVDWGLVLLSFILAGRAVGNVEPIDELMRVLFIGHVVGLASMVPGGLGTADAVWLKQLAQAGVGANHAAAHVMLFRMAFYVIPWLLSLLVIAIALGTHRLVRNGNGYRPVEKK